MLKVPVTEEDHVEGNPGAPVVLVEYGDYECPHCGRAYPIVKRLQRHFGEQLALVYRNFPLNEIHPDAEAAAETAEFAGAHGQFWPMHDALFENQENLGAALFADLSGKLGLNAPELESALSANTYTPRVRGDFLGGVRSGVNGTPTFFINGQRHDGTFDFEDLVAAIESRLS